MVDAYFIIMSALGDSLLYVSFLPWFMWVIDPAFGRSFLLLLITGTKEGGGRNRSYYNLNLFSSYSFFFLIMFYQILLTVSFFNLFVPPSPDTAPFLLRNHHWKLSQESFGPPPSSLSSVVVASQARRFRNAQHSHYERSEHVSLLFLVVVASTCYD